MPKRKKRRVGTKDESSSPKEESVMRTLREETLRSVASIALFVGVIFLLLAAFDKAGIIGVWSFRGLTFLLGIGYFLLPLLLLLVAIALHKTLERAFSVVRMIGSFLFFVAGLGLIDLILADRGGIIGSAVATPLVALFEIQATFIFLGALLLISLLIIFDARLFPVSFFSLRSLFKKGGSTDVAEDGLLPFGENVVVPREEKEGYAGEEGDAEALSTPTGFARVFGAKKDTVQKETSEKESAFGVEQPATHVNFTPPPLSLLEEDRGKPGVGDIKANTNVIKRTLQNFGINVEMDEVAIGPTVTRYALKPAEGVKLSRIVGLKNDLSLALAAHPIRIEAPIPGKALVGIEIPNTTKTTVGLASLLKSADFQNTGVPLSISLGKGISGKLHFASLARMPHLLIAGATGSGKSVAIHTIITSLLFKSAPEDVRFIMIDPKRVELTLYNKIPHLLTPVITNAKQTILALKWAAKEMDRRYDVLETESVRDISSYHKNIFTPALEKIRKRKKRSDNEESEASLPERMPYIIVIIDELADIMQAYPRELESAIVRLAQMSRAVGIHLILSTQRPSVNIITGLIKANIPARIALQVASQIDSRTILDMGGAETLLGAGDMLYLSGEMSKPQRIQSAFVSEAEVKRVVKFLTQSYEDAVPSEINLSAENDKGALLDAALANDGEEDDDLYEDAREIVMQAGKASTSYLQRKLRVGYARAARLMDILEERDVIGPADGSKPRQVLDMAYESVPASGSEEVDVHREEQV